MSAVTTNEVTTAGISAPSVPRPSWHTPARSSSRCRTVFLLAGVCVCSWVAWSGWTVWVLPLSLALPFVLGQCENRCSVASAAALYFAVALGPCIHGSQVFFNEKSPLGGSLLWAAWTLLLAAVFALCWHRQPVLRTGLIGVALMIHALLPVGLASPLTSAGVLFPATGFFGCLFAFVLCLAISGRFWKLAASLALAVFLLKMHLVCRLLPVRRFRRRRT